LEAYGAGAGALCAIGPATISLTCTQSRLGLGQYFAVAANAQGRNIAFNIGEVNVTYVGAPFLQFGLPNTLAGLLRLCSRACANQRDE
jgi:hypothetical protein